MNFKTLMLLLLLFLKCHSPLLIHPHPTPFLYPLSHQEPVKAAKAAAQENIVNMEVAQLRQAEGRTKAEFEHNSLKQKLEVELVGDP